MIEAVKTIEEITQIDSMMSKFMKVEAIDKLQEDVLISEAI